MEATENVQAAENAETSAEETIWSTGWSGGKRKARR